MLRNPVMAVLAALVAACAPAPGPELSTEHAQSLRDSVAGLMTSIQDGLAAGGPMAWLEYFESTAAFSMASDGRIAFPSIDSARAFLDVFSKSVAGMVLEWENIRVEPLQPGIAAVGTAYRESITDTSGVTLTFGGYMTGVARNTPAGWRLQSLHWSSPVPTR